MLELAVPDAPDSASSFLGAPPSVGGVASEQMLAEVEKRLFGDDGIEPVVIDRYELLDRIGTGGMGVVYAARDPQLDRKVAIKLYARLGTSSSAADDAKRATQEARALASFSHPNVVHVYDVGDRDGELYIVMEYVEGTDLAQWIHASPRPWREVLDVFIDAGKGLQAAHTQCIVHRDFKPGNVLVGTDGRARVADFGLAIGSEPEARTSTALSGSPAYLAPEQHDGRGADERSDQYSFCVALFEAVYGRRPFEGDTLDKLAAAKARGPTAVEGVKIPRGLARLILRGLEREPAARHPSMAALVEALVRVRAGPRRAYVALGIVGAAALAAGTWSLGTAASGPSCVAGPDRLAGVWDDARREELRRSFTSADQTFAAQTWALVEAALDERATHWTDAYTDACEATHVRGEQSTEALDLRMRCLDESLSELRGLIDAFAAADASVLERAIPAVHSLRPLAACRDPAILQAEILVPSSPEARRVVGDLRAELAQVRALSLAGQFPEGLAALEEIREGVEAADFEPLTAEFLVQRGALHSRVSDYEASRGDYTDAYWLAAGVGDDRVAARAAIGRSCLECIHLAQGGTGLEWAQHARVALGRISSSPILEGEQLTCSGNCLARAGRVEEARGETEKALAAFERAGAPEYRLVRPLSSLGLMAWMEKDSDAALSYFERSLETAERVSGDKHPGLSVLKCNVAIEYLRRNRRDEARALYLEALEITEGAFGADNAKNAKPLVGLGRLAIIEKQHTQAREYYERALSIQERAFGKSHPDLLDALIGLGDIDALEQKPESAKLLYERALGIADSPGTLDRTVAPRVQAKIEALGLGATVDDIGG